MKDSTKYYLFLILAQVGLFFLINQYPDYFWPIIVVGDLFIAFVLNYLSYPAGFRDKCWTDKDFHKRVFTTFGIWIFISIVINLMM